MKKFLFLLFSACLCLISKAQESQTSYNFLRVPVSAHASALGGENITIIEDDATLSLCNPALLQSVNNKSISFGYMNYMSGANIFAANYALPINEKATVGVSAQYVDYGKMKQTDVSGTIIGNFRASDLAIGGTLSYTLADKLVGGVTAKFIYSNIADYNSTAAAIDLGINYYDDAHNLSASIVARNLGGQLSAYDEEFEKLPAELQAGVSKKLTGTPFRVSLTATDLTHWNYSFFRHLNIGADVMLSQQIYIAAGYNFRRAHEMSIASLNDFGEEDESSHGAGLTLGGGINLEKFKLNVAYGKYHVSSSSITLNIAFSL